MRSAVVIPAAAFEAYIAAVEQAVPLAQENFVQLA
jgi:hypothetical protein